MKLRKDKLINSICILLLPLVSYGILGPLEIYAASPADFSVSMWTVLLTEGLVSFIVFAVGCLLLVLLPDNISHLLTKMVFILSIISYVQYMFLNRQLAREDGNRMDWDAMRDTQVINTIIWVVLIVALSIGLHYAHKHWGKIDRYVSLGLAAVQLVAVISILLTTSAGSNDTYHLSSENQYTVAKDKNIIILIMDSYGNRMFDAALNDNPDLYNQFRDFTYYNNCDSQYDRTYPTVTSMITGIPFDFDSENPESYTTKAWESDRNNRFFDILHDNGWEFDVYASNFGYNYGNLICNSDKIDNTEYVEGSIRWKRLLLHFTKTSIYKFAPYIVKPYFEEITSDFRDINEYPNSFDDHLEHLSRILDENGLSVLDSTSNRITIFHTFGAHDAKSTEDLELCHDFIENYFDELKRIGMYDNSTIIVTADHGMMWSFEGQDPQPMFLIKNKNEIGDRMKISTAPISEEDFQATILNLTELNQYNEDNSFGKSIFEFKDDEVRERTVYFKESDNKYAGYTYNTNREELLQLLKTGPSVYGEKNSEQ